MGSCTTGNQGTTTFVLFVLFVVLLLDAVMVVVAVEEFS
jgi:hypothetical protein